MKDAGGIAQLVEHRVCNARVTGSSPITSTSFQAETHVSAFFVKFSGFEKVLPPPPLLKNFLTIILKRILWSFNIL